MLRTLIIKGLLIVLLTAVLLGTVYYFLGLLSAIACRGIECLDHYADQTLDKNKYKIRDACFIVSSPTGIGIFKDKPFGGVVRNLLGFEYIVFSHEFLFIKFNNQPEKPIIIISDSGYIIDVADTEYCSHQMTFSIIETAEDTTIVVK